MTMDRKIGYPGQNTEQSPPRHTAAICITLLGSGLLHRMLPVSGWLQATSAERTMERGNDSAECVFVNMGYIG